VLYLDANIFIYAAINTQELGEKVCALLKKIQLGEEEAETSVLTYDEVFWALKKHDWELAFQVCEAFLDFPNLKIIPTDRELAFSALRLVRECRLDLRDALHAATALAEKADYLVSTDAHFDRVKGLRRKAP
jgi:predicted nucleic acid-binding protein